MKDYKGLPWGLALTLKIVNDRQSWGRASTIPLGEVCPSPSPTKAAVGEPVCVGWDVLAQLFSRKPEEGSHAQDGETA